MGINNFFKLVIAIAVSELAGIIGLFFTASAIPTWYAGLVKPALNPPSWIFGPVWTMLYTLLGIALFLIWSSYAKASDGQIKQHPNILAVPRSELRSTTGENVRMLRIWKIGIAAFFIQLFLNTLWSIIFFGSTSLTIYGLNNIGIALIEIVFLWLAILATIVAFYKISPPSSSIWTTAGHGKLAAWLLVPYLLWVSFAGYLNYAIWVLN